MMTVRQGDNLGHLFWEKKSQIISTLAHWFINIFGADYRHNGQRRKLKNIVAIAWNYKEMLHLTLLEWSSIYMYIKAKLKYIDVNIKINIIDKWGGG